MIARGEARSRAQPRCRLPPPGTPRHFRNPQVLARWACDKVSAAAASMGDEELLAALQVRAGGAVP